MLTVVRFNGVCDLSGGSLTTFVRNPGDVLPPDSQGSILVDVVIDSDAMDAVLVFESVVNEVDADLDCETDGREIERVIEPDSETECEPVTLID